MNYYNVFKEDSIDAWFNKMEQIIFQKKEKNKSEDIFYEVSYLDSQVLNGGIHQWKSNILNGSVNMIDANSRIKKIISYCLEIGLKTSGGTIDTYIKLSRNKILRFLFKNYLNKLETRYYKDFEKYRNSECTFEIAQILKNYCEENVASFEIQEEDYNKIVKNCV